VIRERDLVMRTWWRSTSVLAEPPRAARRRFRDRVRILVAGGDGGAGCASTFRDANVERGGPDGGSGGGGGAVMLRASHNASDLHLEKRNFKAGPGGNGMGSQMHGARGTTLELEVPCGTLVQRLGQPSASRTSRMEPPDSPTMTITELLRDGDSVCVARGGRGGRGNAAFRQGLQQHSRIAEEGGAGEAVTLLLSLKLIADVGLVGFPNAGKSSLLRALSNATPKVAPYPFTTIHPHLGRVRASKRDEFTVADVPGLVEGAHANRGLGHSFLRHLERTKLLCYVLDLEAPQAPVEQLASLRRELRLYQPGLEEQPCILVANKADVEGAPARLRALRSAVGRLRAEGGLPGLIDTTIACGGRREGGNGEGGGNSLGSSQEGDGDAGDSAMDELKPSVAAGSVVTAVSAREAGNLTTLVMRMYSALTVASRLARDRDAATVARQQAEHALTGEPDQRSQRARRRMAGQKRQERLERSQQTTTF